VDIGETIRGSSEWKLSKAGVSGNGVEQVEEGEGELKVSSYVSMFGRYSEMSWKVGTPMVTEISWERVSRALYSTGYTPEGGRYIGIE
jgi:hypothetical protein